MCTQFAQSLSLCMYVESGHGGRVKNDIYVWFRMRGKGKNKLISKIMMVNELNMIISLIALSQLASIFPFVCHHLSVISF